MSFQDEQYFLDKDNGLKGMPSDTHKDSKERDTEFVAMNIVHQLGDALYEALPPDIAHKYFVDARQKTNDIAIDFAKKLIESAERAARIDELENLSMAVVEPCEPDCDDVRHALHEGSWQAHLVIEERLAALRKQGGGDD